MPMRQAVRVSCTVAAELPSESVTSGSAGRYMSIDSGAIAVRPPRVSVRNRAARRPGLGGSGACRTAVPCGAGGVVGEVVGTDSFMHHSMVSTTIY
ncbi:hypothetical protein GCM10020221_27320 [Streptomyces thioluteus]|uniref:Uncharacterized protein n=1 Tax=Streptomyces thioluteus TaxID=66431 RepID=A0ABP6JDV1_STRTU